MFYTNMLPANSPITTYVLVALCFLTLIGTLWALRKMAVNENKKMLEAQAFATQNPDKIDKIKLVDHREVFCVVTIKDKEPTIIAQGVQAVRVFDQLILANPKLVN